VLIGGLRALGCEVLECHRPVFELVTHKAGSALGPRGLVRLGARYAGAWAHLAGAQRHLGRLDAVVAGYLAQPDAVPAWAVARAHRCPLVVDMMISLADTLAGDRGRAGRAAEAVLAGADRLTLALADLVLADTEAGARFLTRRFGVRPDRVAVVPVGAEPGVFPPAPPPEGPPECLWYGKLAPMHGLEVILAAARMPGVPPVRLVGDGQLGAWLRRELDRDRPPGLSHVPWVPYERLGAEVARAAVCLGVFGTSAKASRVVPNKVFQAMAVGRPVVTAAGPGIGEALTDGVEGLLVPPGDPAALAAALITLAGDPARRAAMGAAARARYLAQGTPEAVASAMLAALRARLGITLPA
jgi:glycosyltransferase involved in cell wall biosynthesis